MNTKITELAAQMRGLAVEADKIGAGWQRVRAKTIYSVYPFGNDYLIANFEDSSCAEFCAAANPANVITILDALEATQAEIERLKEITFTPGELAAHGFKTPTPAEFGARITERLEKKWLAVVEKVHAERNEALARLAEIEKAHTVSDQNISLIAHNEAAEDWNDLTFRDGWFAGFKDGFRAAEVQHGIKERHDAQ